MYGTNVPSKRPGQTRFEAWVPTDLAAAFTKTIPNKTAWLRKAMQDALGVQPAPPAAPPHRHKRVQVDTKMVAGTRIPIYKCKDCGVTLNA